jgi:release factor glutamine methyltransferase
MIDVGTGSGCIAVTLAAERRDLQVIATDRSLEALKIAKGNASQYAVTERIDWVQSDLLLGIYPRVDLILANLPYIPSARLKKLAVAAYEPRMALDGGELGLDLIVRLIDQMPNRLVNPGMAILEVDDAHAQAVAERMHSVFPVANIGVLPDLNLQARYVVLTLAGET